MGGTRHGCNERHYWKIIPQGPLSALYKFNVGFKGIHTKALQGPRL